MSQEPTQGRESAPDRTSWWVLVTRNKILLVCAVFFVISIVMIVVAILIGANKDDAPPASGRPPQSQVHEFYSQGAEWAAGYMQALNNGTPTVNEADAMTSLYGACVLRASTTIGDTYGDELSHSWLSGCLSLVTAQTNTLTTKVISTPSGG